MASYVKVQEDLLARILKAKSNYKKSPKERLTLSYIETRLEGLEQQWTSFTSTHRKLVYEVKKEELEASSYYINDVYDQTEETYIEYKCLLKEALLKLKPSTSQGPDKPNKESNVKLPKISLPTFSGKYSEWTSFRDLFVSLVHKNDSLDDVQKLHYLKGCVTGEAEQLLRHTPVTADNYSNCWEQLENRYNNKRYLANCILGRLVGQKPLTTESSTAIKQLLDTTKECLHALENLGIDIKSWDIIVIYIVSQKLDQESRKLWEQKVSESTQELPKLSSFTGYLETRFRSLEFLDPKVQKNEKANSSSHTVTTVSSCAYCSEYHKLYNCKIFAKETVDARRSFVQTHHLCFNCLNPDHTVYQCKVSTKCRLCNKRHHTLLHPKNPNSNPKPDDLTEPDHSENTENNVVANVVEGTTPSQNQVPQTQNEPADTQVFTTSFPKTRGQVLLATALVKVIPSKPQTAIVFRALLDQGSQASFITEAAVQMLKLNKIPGTSLVSGIGGDQGSTVRSKSTVIIKIQSRLDPSFTLTVKAHVLNKLTTFLPSKRVVVKVFPALASMQLADPAFDMPNKIDLLLGADVYSQILLEGMVKSPSGSLVAQHTRLGWILSGKVLDDPETHDDNSASHNVIINMHVVQSDMNHLLKRFWEQESEPLSRKTKYLTDEEKKCEELFSATTKRDETGRYIVRLPFKTDDQLCKYGSSKAICHQRFLMLEKRFLKNPNLQIEYSKVINEYLELDHVDLVDVTGHDNPNAVYLPHHAVIRQDKSTTKVRVVFDASCAGTNGVSLNNDLMVGPTLQPELRHLVMRWRCYPICLIADIVKMYRQVKVAEEDVDFQRILWRENPNAALQHLRHLRVTFGTSSAPYLAVRALQQVAHDEGKDFPLAAPRVLTDFYMDDLMTGCHSIEEGVQIYEQITEMLSRGGFPLQKWSSSNMELLQHITGDKDKREQNLELKTDETVKILGLAWNRSSDEFRCVVNLPSPDTPVTKRKVISDISRLFDPLGWLAPVITTAKVFIQKLWLAGIDWDDKLTGQLLKDWLDFRNNLQKLVVIRIPRWIHSNKNDKCMELHGFSDASNLAYAAVVYARIISKNGDIHVSLITSKTRVAPIKQVSIPRLELCGAVLAAKLLNEVAETLEVEKPQLHAWTDSSIVLAWLSSHPSRWKTFVANKVSEILTIMDGNQWAHVVSRENPADCASRGIPPTELAHNQLWKKGPEWLYQQNIDYSKRYATDTTLEERKSNPKVRCHVTAQPDENEDGDIISRFSSIRKLTRVLAYCRRVLNWKKPEKGKNKLVKTWLTAEEIDEALLTCIKLTQTRCFQEDIQTLQQTGKLHKKSKFTSLSPFLDADDVLRVGGRIQGAEIDSDMKHPVILPHKSHFTVLLISEAHERTMHGGPQLMLNYLRNKYWIIGAKQIVRHFVRKCVTCVRHAAQTKQQMMGQLPTARVTPQRAFFKSGVDYAGPINIKTTKGRGHRSTKGYICLFICMATKAIHLEVVSDMTSEGFLAAFKRFVARRGHVADIWSDNGSNFVGSARELKDMLDAEKSSVPTEIANWLTSNGTNWHFIPPYSPNFGGLWEAGIKSTKHHLKRVIGNSTLTFEEMATTLSQIEACLNSRPLTPLSTNAEDPSPLTPGHFLVGEALVLVPDRNYENSNISNLKRWHLTQKMLQDFWRRWSQEYLTQLQHRYKWSNQTPEPNVGDIVLVKEDNLPPGRWLFGLVTEKHPGLDNLTRVISLKCKGTIMKRPVSKLICLPLK